MRKQKKSTVWYVDDLKLNRDKFLEHHKKEYNIKLFEIPAQVEEALKKERPDALLCDIYFISDEKKREQIEEEVTHQKEILDKFAQEHQLNHEKYQAGVNLIENIHKKLMHNITFPIYAYTSKGPYLLNSKGFEKLAELKVSWLFKNRLDSNTESMVINRDIAEYKRLRGLRKRIIKHPITSMFASAFIGFLVTVTLKFLLNFLGVKI